jgi:hypothetical protein
VFLDFEGRTLVVGEVGEVGEAGNCVRFQLCSLLLIAEGPPLFCTRPLICFFQRGSHARRRYLCRSSSRVAQSVAEQATRELSSHAKWKPPSPIRAVTGSQVTGSQVTGQVTSRLDEIR